MNKLEFDVEIISPAQAPKAAFVNAPFDVKEQFGTKGRIAVKGTMDGEPFKGTFQPMGGKHIMGVPKEMRKKIGKTHGDIIHIVMQLDTEPRAVELPDDFKKALKKNPKAQKAYDSFAYSYQKEYARWITSAKKPDTREKRLKEAIERLNKGEKPK